MQKQNFGEDFIFYVPAKH